jgi:transcriptional regulator with XRE-family HTH domain
VDGTVAAVPRQSPPPPPLLVALGRVVRDHREALGLPQESVGDLHRNTIGKVERAQINLTVLQLARLASALGTSSSALLVEAEQRLAQ